MSEETEITCDSCHTGISCKPGYPAHYCLELRARNVAPTANGMVYAIHVESPLDGVKQFCGVRCLKEWINEQSLP